MTNRRTFIALGACLMAMFAACDSMQPKVKAPIILGDSSLIVTEPDQEQLKDLVVDLQPVIPPAAEPEEEKQEPVADTPITKPPPAQTATAKVEPQPVQAVSNLPGLTADFGELVVKIPGLDAKLGGNKTNLKKAYGAAYMLYGGEINGATMLLTGDVSRVSQRYQSIIIMKTDVGDIPLDGLMLTENWEEISGRNNTYKISGLDPKSLHHKKPTNSEIRSAVQRAAKRRRLSRNKIRELVDEVDNVRSVTQKPLFVALSTAMWKIDGKDANGKPYSRQIRIDIPM